MYQANKSFLSNYVYLWNICAALTLVFYSFQVKLTLLKKVIFKDIKVWPKIK